MTKNEIAHLGQLLEEDARKQRGIMDMCSDDRYRAPAMFQLQLDEGLIEKLKDEWEGLRDDG